MSRRPGIIGQIWLNFKNSLSAPRQGVRLAGQDEFGNKFYEKEADPKRNLRMSRWIEPLNPDQFEVPQIHPQWDTWLRGRRKYPPTAEEIARDLAITERTLQRARELEEKHQQESVTEASPEKSDKESYVTDITSDSDDRSFPTYSDYESVPGDQRPAQRLQRTKK